MMHPICFKISLWERSGRHSSMFLGPSSSKCRRRFCPSTQQMLPYKTRLSLNSENSNFINALKHNLRSILNFSGLSPAMLLHRADVDFSICRFVKYPGIFWFSIKNILPKWLQSPMPENKCTSFLFLSSMCSAFNRNRKIKLIM